jgi:hypothetical protein
VNRFEPPPLHERHRLFVERERELRIRASVRVEDLDRSVGEFLRLVLSHPRLERVLFVRLDPEDLRGESFQSERAGPVQPFRVDERREDHRVLDLTADRILQHMQIEFRVVEDPRAIRREELFEILLDDLRVVLRVLLELDVPTLTLHRERDPDDVIEVLPIEPRRLRVDRDLFLFPESQEKAPEIPLRVDERPHSFESASASSCDWKNFV